MANCLPPTDDVQVADAIRKGAQRLAQTSDTSRLDTELLMAHALGCSRSDMLLKHMQDAAPQEFTALLNRRAAHEPVAHITGVQEFFGRPFAVTPDVLIPRADSESVVEAALAAAPNAKRVCDCGTGSGILLLTLLAEIPAATGVGIDASSKAVAIAAQNAKALGVVGRAEICEADWTQPGWSAGLDRFDLVISNPPYVEAAAQLAPDVRDFEPAEALFAGPEGLDDYRILIPQLPDLLTENGVAVLEIGQTQASAVTQIAENHGFSAEVQKDLGGRDRAFILRLRLGKGESTS